MKAIVYKLECLTNMHAGSGDINFNVTDNEVERDPVTGYPTINSSGIKGSLREFFEINMINDKDENEIKEIKDIFGSERENVETDKDKNDDQNKDKNRNQNNDQSKNQKTSTPGNVKFLSANMLAMPMRSSDNNHPYYMVTTKTAIDNYIHLMESLGITINFNINDIKEEKSYKSPKLGEGTKIEEINISESIDINTELHYFLEKHLKERYCILTDKDFLKLSLPVISRNRLDEDGKSKGLWYEEIVPHKSIFYFVALSYNKKFDDCLAKFHEKIDNKVIQFGGNASIGYGFSKVNCIGGYCYEQK